MAELDVAKYGPLSFPIYWGRKVLNIWTNDSFQLAAATTGTAVFAYIVYYAGSSIWHHFLRPSKLQVYCHSTSGSWALVTGASDGIGRAMADELLARGFHVLLHGRNEEKLKGVQAELARRYPKRTVEYVVADASSPDHPEDAVADRAKSLPGKLTVLVNNVGGTTSKPHFVLLSESTADQVDSLITLNARFTTQLTRALLPTLKQNNPALILNISSFAAAGVPYLATYSAAKGHVNALSHALRGEMLAEGMAGKIEVLTFAVGNVMTNGNRDHMPLITTTAAECARGCLAKVGCGETVTHAHWRHALQSWVMLMLPARVTDRMSVEEMGKRAEAAKKEM